MQNKYSVRIVAEVMYIRVQSMLHMKALELKYKVPWPHCVVS